MRFLSTTGLVLGGSLLVRAASKVYLCGDSTMTRNSGNIQGWGEYLQYSLPSTNFVVVNKAIGGRSARSFTREGRFDEVVGLLQPGDWVVIEFGHNDGGSLSNDNGRSDCFGDGTETCKTVYK
jgi:rhamnogalacturonan acetylesterase